MTDREKKIALWAGVAIVVILLLLMLRKNGGNTYVTNRGPLNYEIGPPVQNSYELPGLPDINLGKPQAGAIYVMPTFDPDHYDFGDFNLPDVRMADMNVSINPKAITLGLEDKSGKELWQSTNLICGCDDGEFRPAVFIDVQQPPPPPTVQYVYIDRTRYLPATPAPAAPRRAVSGAVMI